MENKWKYTRYARAKKRMEGLKGFYQHLTAYLLVNLGLFLVKSIIFDFFSQIGANDPNFLDWVYWNIVATPVIWGVGLLIHGLYVFRFKAISLKDLKPKRLKDWEERQIQKYMEEDSSCLGNSPDFKEKNL